MKKILNMVPVRYFLAGLFWLYCQLCYRTQRVEYADKARLQEYMQAEKPSIFVLWHGRMMFMPILASVPKRCCVVVSRHGDGGMIATVLGLFGIRTIRGSSSKRLGAKAIPVRDRGGRSAIVAALKALATGQHLVVTPDGPRGPRMRVNSKVAEIAARAGVAVVPVTFSCSRHRIIHSWDRFMVPLPFGRTVVMVGEPLYFTSHAKDEGRQNDSLAVEHALNRITFGADVEVGMLPILPADGVK